MHKKLEVNQTKINGGCQSHIKAEPQQSWSDLTLGNTIFLEIIQMYISELKKKHKTFEVVSLEMYLCLDILNILT